MKIKFLKKEKNFKKDQTSIWLNINFYWKLAVLGVCIILLASLSFGYYLFMQINKEIVSDTAPRNSETEVAKKERIDTVLEYFSTKRQKSNQILISPTPVVDPSL